MTKANLPPNYRPSDDESYMNENHLEYFRQKLEAWRSDLIEESNKTLSHLREENHNISDPNDQATEETERAYELRTRDRYRKLIVKIDEALERIKIGEYGYCEDTGKKIGLKRLEARPVATLCIEAQERHENYENTHADEEKLSTNP